MRKSLTNILGGFNDYAPTERPIAARCVLNTSGMEWSGGAREQGNWRNNEGAQKVNAKLVGLPLAIAMVTVALHDTLEKFLPPISALIAAALSGSEFGFELSPRLPPPAGQTEVPWSPLNLGGIASRSEQASSIQRANSRGTQPPEGTDLHSY